YWGEVLTLYSFLAVYNFISNEFKDLLSQSYNCEGPNYVLKIVETDTSSLSELWRKIAQFCRISILVVLNMYQLLQFIEHSLVGLLKKKKKSGLGLELRLSFNFNSYQPPEAY
ncbi:hypothetical protein BpHYR1_038129, partial [Brachionus plicatilis]